MEIMLTNTKDYGQCFDTETLNSPLDAWSINSKYKQEQFEKGRKLALDGFQVSVAINGVWSALKKESESTSVSIQSYEKLGYHAHTKALVEGFLAEKGKIYFHGFRGLFGWAEVVCKPQNA